MPAASALALTAFLDLGAERDVPLSRLAKARTYLSPFRGGVFIASTSAACSCVGREHLAAEIGRIEAVEIFRQSRSTEDGKGRPGRKTESGCEDFHEHFPPKTVGHQVDWP